MSCIIIGSHQWSFNKTEQELINHLTAENEYIHRDTVLACKIIKKIKNWPLLLATEWYTRLSFEVKSIIRDCISKLYTFLCS